MPKEKSRVIKNGVRRDRPRSLAWLVVAVLVMSLCAVGIVARLKGTLVQSQPPLQLQREYIHAGGKLIATEAPGNVAPAVSITAPANNSIFAANSNLQITVNASDSDGTISQVQLYQGATLLGTATAAGAGVYTYTWNNVAAGTYTLTAKATDNSSAVNTAIVNVISNSSPVVSITNPVNNHTFAAGSNLPIAINATDSDGTVSQVQVFQGATLLGSATSAGGGVYNYTWSSVPAGSYSLTAKATDNRNALTASSPINVSATAPGSNSLSLNGTSAYAEVANSTSLNVTGSITVEAWVKVNAIDGNHHDIVSRIDRNVAGSGGGYALAVNGVGKARLDLFQSPNQYTTVIGTTVLSTGVWHHVAGVFDGSQMRVYVDGVLDGSLSTTSGPGSGISLLRIGKAAHAALSPPLYLPPFYFAGLIDEVRVTAGVVYSSNFTPATSLSSVSGTRGLWKFDNQSPADSSANNNVGSLQGGATYSTSVP